MGMTLCEKILAKAVGRKRLEAGEAIEPAVDIAMSHENASIVVDHFLAAGRGGDEPARLWDASKVAIIFDHRTPAENPATANDQKRVREFVRSQGIGKFHEIRGDEGGICHQVLPENGYVRPGMVVVGTDAHTATQGALGTMAWGVGTMEMASIWRTGRVPSMVVPPTIKVLLEGRLPEMVSAKDIILALIGKIGARGAEHRVLEFHGSALESMTVSNRMVLSNMAPEAGAMAGIIPADFETLRYLSEEAGLQESLHPLEADATASYEQTVRLSVRNMEPQIACPHTVDNVKPVSAVEGKRVDQIVIGSCTNGRLDDLALAAKILRGQKVARSTRLLVFPASGRVYREAMEKGYIQDLMEAGAVVMNAGCGCCSGLHQGILGDNEVALSTTNRNVRGRMGNAGGSIYLCSPAVAAVSALTGCITDPTKVGC